MFCLHPVSLRNYKYSLMQIDRRPCNIFLNIQTALNRKVIQYKVVDFVELYKFDLLFIFIRLHMKKLEKNIHMSCVIIGANFIVNRYLWTRKCWFLIKSQHIGNAHLAPYLQVPIYYQNRRLCVVHRFRFVIIICTYDFGELLVLVFVINRYQ